MEKKKLLCICGLNLLLVLAVMIFFIPMYETDDDFALGVIASGGYGREYMQYLVYSNIVYGYVLKLVGILFAGVNWYVVMQYILLTVAVISVFYVVSFYLPMHVVVFANLLFWYAGFFEQIRRIQYTRTASFLAIAGFVLLWNAFKAPKKGQGILGFILCVAGACLRLKCFALCAVFFCPLFFLFCFSGGTFQKDMFRKQMACLAVLSCFIGILAAVDYITYSGDGEWAFYRDYNDVRTELLDYEIPSWKENKEKYKEIGFSGNDVELFSNWILADFEKYNYEDLSKVASWREKPKLTVLMAKQFMKDFLAQKHSVLWFDLWLALVIACLLRNHVCRLYSMINAGLLLGEYFYLYYIGRTLPRVEYGIIFSAIFGLVTCLMNYREMKSDPDVRLQNKCIAGILVFSLLFLGNDYVSNYRDYYREIKEKGWEKPGKILESLSENKDSVYLLDPLSFMDTCNYYAPYKKAPSYYQSNFYFLGGWTTNAPFNKKLLNQLGLENPMSDLIHKDNVYYVKAAALSTDSEVLFFRENYDRNIGIQLVGTVNGYNIYRFAAQKD